MKRRPYMLSESTWTEIKEKDIELAVLPWGACEAHNYHLPYGTDIYEADYVAAEAGKKAYENEQRFVVLPTIPFGVNTGQMDIRLDMNIYPSTQMAILSDTIEVLSNAGIEKLLVVNSHGGNNFKPLLRELGAHYPDIHLSLCHWFKAVDKYAYFQKKGDHADEMETSVMMHLYPEWIDLASAGPGDEKQTQIKGINEGWAWSERRWSLVTEDTGIGDPSLSTSEKGKRFLGDCTDKLAELYIQLCMLDLNNMYPSTRTQSS